MEPAKETAAEGMDPCSTCSQEYEACIVYEFYEGIVTKDCANWTEWRDDWDEKAHKVIDDALAKYTRLDLNSYTVNYKLQVGPDGKVIRWEMDKPPGGSHPPDPYSRTPPFTLQELQELGEIGAKTWSEMAEWGLEQFSKIQACPFPKGSRFKTIERTPSIYHNVKGKEGKTPSPIPQEPPS